MKEPNSLSFPVCKNEKQELINKSGLTDYFEKYGELFDFIFDEYHNIIRTGWKKRFVIFPESDLEHVMGMIELCDVLCPKLGLNTEKCKLMCFLHEVGEIKIGDITPIEGYPVDLKSQQEISYAKEKLPEELYELFLDFELKRTDEGKFVFQLDKAQSIIRAFDYEVEKGYDLQKILSDGNIYEYSLFLEFYNHYVLKNTFTIIEIKDLMNYYFVKHNEYITKNKVNGIL